MRGTSLISLGIILLIIALILVFALPGSQPVPPVGVDIKGSQAPGDKSVPDAPMPRRTLQPLAMSDSAEAASPSIARLPGPEDPGDSPAGAGAAAGAAAGAVPDSAGKPVLSFPEWPKPQLALIVTGEQHGYFEPCGCTANQLGGMNRRAALVDRLKEMGWDVRGVDLGSLSRRSARQSQIKFETTLQALRQMNYVALGLGPEELRLDPGYLISQHVSDGEQPLAFLSANLTFYGVADLGTPLPLRVFQVDEMVVGVTSVLSESRKQEVIPEQSSPPDDSSDIQWQDPALALRQVEEQFQAQDVTFRILLSQSSVEESRELARQFPQFDLIVTAGGYGDGERKPEVIGKTRLLQVGEKGKYAGVVGVYPQDAQPIRFELVTLSGATFGESEEMIALMKTYQERLIDERLVATESVISHPSGARFVGAATCGECHTKAFEIWQNTAHAHAFDSLDPAHQREGYERLNGVVRTHDPECLACHVTGWNPQEYLRYRSGFLNEDMATSDNEKLLQSLLANNQCENCHGPGSLHIEQIEAGNLEAARPLVKAVLQESACVKCHDGENSPDFKFEAYWNEIKHSGLD